MDELPAELLAALPTAGVSAANQWWASLSESDRSQVGTLWDTRLEVCFFTPQADDAGCVDPWERVPTVQGGRFVPSDDDGRQEWMPEYFEHLLQHPELVLVYEPIRRTFYIGCTQHRDARECLAAGEVPAEFICPVDSTSCPLARLRGSRLTSALPR